MNYSQWLNLKMKEGEIQKDKVMGRRLGRKRKTRPALCLPE